MDRKRYIIRNTKLSGNEIENIKIQVQRELRRNSLNTSRVSNINSTRLSNIFTSENQIEENSTTQLSENQQENNSQNVENAQLLNDLSNHMDTTITEFYGTDPTERFRIPKLKPSKKLNDILYLMNNVILVQFINEITNLETLQYIIYCAAIATVRTLGITIKPHGNHHNTNNKPPWMKRLEKRIDEIRSKLGRLTAYRNGTRTSKLCRKVTNIIKPLELCNLNDHILIEIIDTHTQKLSALSKRLRRYCKCTERKNQNKAFSNNEKQFYKQFNNEHTNFNDGSPSIVEIEKFWSNIWEKPVLHEDGMWLEEEIKRNNILHDMDEIIVTTENVKETIKYCRNWSSPGLDSVQNFWYKKLFILHQKVAECFNKVIENPREMPSFMTYLIPKDSNTSNPAKYRPITCLSCLFKILTSVISKKIQEFCEINNLISEEQKGCKRNTHGCKDQLIIDAVITGQASHKARNLSMAFIDFKKAYDMVPHSYLIKILQVYKINPTIVRFLENIMNKWRTMLIITDRNKTLKSRPINIKRGIFQGDSLSPLWFCLAMNPISKALNETKFGYQIHYGNQKLSLTHSFYMDDLKLYASSVTNLHKLLYITKDISTRMKMEFGIDKCKSIQIRHGQIIQTNGFEIEDERIVDLTKEENYKFLGFLQLKHIHHTEIKKKLKDKFEQRLKQIFGTLLNSRNKMKAVNTYAIPLLTYSFGIIKWSSTDLIAIETSLRTIMTKYRMHHRSSAKERINLPRNEGGRGFQDIVLLCKSQIQQLRDYFYISKSRHLIYEAVSEADIGYSVLHLADYEYSFIPEHPNQNEKLTRWKQKELHGTHPHQLNNEHVDKNASNEWLIKGHLFGETEGFIIAIQDRVIATKNYRKYILHQDIPDDKCCKCGNQSETIEHVINGCKQLANTDYTIRHNNAAKIIHQSLILKYGISQQFLPYYKYSPKSIEENQQYKIYWDHPIITDKTIMANRPDIIIYDKQAKSVKLIDIAIPLNHNLQSTFSGKISKYQELADEMKQMWRLKEIHIIPVILSSTGIVPDSLLMSLHKLDLPKSLSYQIQKAVILSTCNIVRRFLNQNH